MQLLVTYDVILLFTIHEQLMNIYIKFVCFFDNLFQCIYPIRSAPFFSTSTMTVPHYLHSVCFQVLCDICIYFIYQIQQKHSSTVLTVQFIALFLYGAYNSCLSVSWRLLIFPYFSYQATNSSPQISASIFLKFCCSIALTWDSIFLYSITL